jgi:hypothetical protein
LLRVVFKQQEFGCLVNDQFKHLFGAGKERVVEYLAFIEEQAVVFVDHLVDMVGHELLHIVEVGQHIVLVVLLVEVDVGVGEQTLLDLRTNEQQVRGVDVN